MLRLTFLCWICISLKPVREGYFLAIISKEQIEYMLSRGYTEKAISEELESGVINWVTLLDNDEIVGVASYGPGDNSEEMQLYKLYVHPRFQRMGYGSDLMKYLRQEATGNGYKYVMLNVNRKNHKAISAYRKNGFVIIESRPTDIGNGFAMDDYIMRNSLF
jgi:ribosomal protein S18 acetylase RimI-like enzyme